MTGPTVYHSDFSSLTALDLLAGYRKRAFSPVEVVKDLLYGIDHLNSDLNAFYFLDHEGALEAAKQSEQRWLNGEPAGLLDGVPSSIKDALETRGWPAYRGSSAYRSDKVVGIDDTPSIARMREHGAIFLGKTTMPDFGILASGKSSKHGVTRNPFDLARTPGGSSAGTAASIAANLTPLAVGTDIVGSIRLPASFCGLYGLKPSQGRVPYYIPNSAALTAGPMSRSVEDAALLMNIITLPDDRDFTALAYDATDYLADITDAPVGRRIGYLPTLGFGAEPDREVLDMASRACKRFCSSGMDLIEVSANFTSDDLLAAESFYKIRCLTELSSIPQDQCERADFIKQWTSDVANLSSVGTYRLFDRMTSLRERAHRLMSDLDYLILPTVHIPPFCAASEGPTPKDIFTPWINCFLFNLTGQPASSVPCGFTSRGLPVGLQIVGRRFDDLGVIRLSHLYQEHFPEHFLNTSVPPQGGQFEQMCVT